MAKYNGEQKSGKLGDYIYSSWRGRPYKKRMPESVANPRTELQQAHRSAFAEISRLSSAMKEAHAEGLHWKAVRDKLDTYSVFKKLNKDCYGADGIDYPCISISYGTLRSVTITAAEVDSQGNVHVEFRDYYATEENKNDLFFLFVFCPDLREGHFARPVERTVGVVDASIPEKWFGHALHLYAFMKGTKGRTSETIYIGDFMKT